MKAYSLEMALQQPEKITELYIHNRGLDQFPARIFQLPNLKKLALTNQFLESIPPVISSLEKLEELDFSGNRIQKLPDSIGLLPRLKNLNLDKNAFSTFPSVILRLISLEKLYLSKNELTELPENISGLEQLKVIDFEKNRIEKIPETIGMLSDLKELNANENVLTRLPKALFQCENLESLAVHENRISQLSREIGHLNKLSFLDFSNNRIQDLPPEIASCRQLIHINLQGNKLKDIPPEIGQLRNLRRLNLSNNKIQILPKELGACEGLKMLQLNGNQLEKLPENMANLKRLEDLSIDKNKLEKLPSFIGEWRNLFSLSLANNRIAELPSNFKNFKKLKSLVLKGNPIAIFPEVLLHLDNLQNLGRSKNITQVKQLLAFLKACKKQQLNAALRLPFYQVLKGDLDALKKIKLVHLYEALNFKIAKIRKAALIVIFENRRIENAVATIKADSEISILGKSNFNKIDLKRQLKKAGFHFVNRPTKKTTHIILGELPGKFHESLSAKLVFLKEKEFNVFVQSLEHKYLLAANNEATLQKVIALLKNKQENNIELAVQILKGGGVPPAILTEIFIAYKNTDNQSLKRKLKSLFDLNASEKAKELFFLRPQFLSKEKVIERLREFKGTELDVQRLSSFFKA